MSTNWSFPICFRLYHTFVVNTNEIACNPAKTNIQMVFYFFSLIISYGKWICDESIVDRQKKNKEKAYGKALQTHNYMFGEMGDEIADEILKLGNITQK